MRIFSSLYNKVLFWARHRHASYYLGVLSFAESSFFPIPPDVMLAPMVLAKRHMAWTYSTITTVASVLGGIAGYGIGVFAFGLVEPVLHAAGYWQDYLQVRQWFSEWGVWVVFIAGFSPIPYKVFTIGAGAVSVSFLPFVIASAIGRGARFFLVAGLIYAGGEKMESALRRNVDMLGWGLVVAMLVIYLAIRFLS